MNGNSAEITILTERIAAQTEAYEKFSQALIKILDMLDALSNQADSEGGDRERIAKGILANISDVADTLQTHVVKSASLSGQLIAKLDENNKLSTQILSELHAHRRSHESLFPELEQLKEKIDDVLINDNDFYDKFITHMNQETKDHTEILTLVKALPSKHDEIKRRMDAQFKEMKSRSVDWVAWWKAAKNYVLGALLVIAVFETLIQFGILKIGR
jgi:chromosome segregation ATPase